MKKMALLLAIVFFVAFTGTAMAHHAPGHFDNTLSANGPPPTGPAAPNSGDGIPDGSGWDPDMPFGPFGAD